jgi:hypothetical protein
MPHNLALNNDGGFGGDGTSPPTFLYAAAFRDDEAVDEIF